MQIYRIYRCAVIFFSTLFYLTLSGMASMERRVADASEKAKAAARAAGKSEAQVRQAARQAVQKEQALVKKELEARGLSVLAATKKEQKKEEQKEPEKPILMPTQPIPGTQKSVKISEKQKQAAPKKRSVSPQERKWAARYEGQREETISAPDQFTNELTVRYGDYLVAWDSKQKKDFVLRCNTPTSCSLESAYGIFVYQLDDGRWVLRGNID